MGEGKHTPGPWALIDGCRIEAPTFGLISSVRGDLATAEVRANAHLIAAAPELLEALKEAERFLDYFANGHTTFGGGGTPRSAHEQVRAAIAKATGGSHER